MASGGTAILMSCLSAIQEELVLQNSLCPRLCPRDRRKHVDFLSISMKADFEKPPPSESPKRDHASAVFTYTYGLR